MEDIVERETALYDEAITEIKRLREMITAQRATYAGYDADRERSGKLIDELVSALAGVAQALVGSFNEIERLQAEVERLRVELKGIEVYAYNLDDAKGMAAKALLRDDPRPELSDKQRHDDGERPHD